jgi:hypothetical protein
MRPTTHQSINTRINTVYLFVFVIAVIFMTSCFKSDSLINDGSSEINESVYEIGTITGNPKPPANKKFLTFSAAINDDEVLSFENACMPFYQNDVILIQSQVCSATPNGVTLGIQSIKVLSCDNGKCDKNTQAVTKYDWYDAGDEILRVSISESVTNFTGALNEITDVNIGAIQPVFVYYESQFYTENESPTEAEKITPLLHGVSYRICMLNHKEVTQDMMKIACDNYDAEYGDYLLDVDGDGVFGYLVPGKDELREVSERPKNYTNLKYKLGFMNLNRILSDEFYHQDLTDEEEAMFAPILPVEAQSFDIASSIHMSFDITNTFRFIDGLNKKSVADGEVCLGSLYKDECGDINSDPFTSNVYHPMFDEALPLIPEASVVVE